MRTGQLDRAVSHAVTVRFSAIVNLRREVSWVPVVFLFAVVLARTEAIQMRRMRSALPWAIFSRSLADRVVRSNPATASRDDSYG